MKSAGWSRWTQSINVPEKDVINLFANQGTQTEKFAIDSMKNGLEKISFTWIFTIE